MDRRPRKGIFLASWAVLLAVAAVFPAGELSAGPSPLQEQGRAKIASAAVRARERWEALPEETRKRLLDRYRAFRSLPEAERRRLRERFKLLESVRKSLDLPDKPRDPRKLEAWKQEVNRRVRRFLEKRVREVDERLGPKAPDGREPRSETDRRARLRAIRARLDRLNQLQLGRFLDRLVKEGLLSPEAADSIRALGPAERRRRLFELAKQHYLRALEGLLPDPELKRLKNLDPFRFHRWRQEGRLPLEKFRVLKRLVSLTPEQRAALERVPEGPERKQREEAFRRKNLVDRLHRLGVKRSEIEAVLGRPLARRRSWILERIEDLRRNAEHLSPAARRLLGLPPRGPRHAPSGRSKQERDRGRGSTSKEKGTGDSPPKREGVEGGRDPLPPGKRLRPPLRSL